MFNTSSKFNCNLWSTFISWYAFVFHACLHMILSEFVVLPFMWLFHIHSGIPVHWMKIILTCRQMWSSCLGYHKTICWLTTKLSFSSHMEVSVVSLAPISEYRNTDLFGVSIPSSTWHVRAQWRSRYGF